MFWKSQKKLTPTIDLKRTFMRQNFHLVIGYIPSGYRWFWLCTISVGFWTPLSHSFGRAILNKTTLIFACHHLWTPPYLRTEVNQTQSTQSFRFCYTFLLIKCSMLMLIEFSTWLIMTNSRMKVVNKKSNVKAFWVSLFGHLNRTEQLLEINFIETSNRTTIF